MGIESLGTSTKHLWQLLQSVTGVLLRLQFSLIQIVLIKAPRKVYTVLHLKRFFVFFSSLHYIIMILILTVQSLLPFSAVSKIRLYKHFCCQSQMDNIPPKHPLTS